MKLIGRAALRSIYVGRSDGGFLRIGNIGRNIGQACPDSESGFAMRLSPQTQVGGSPA
jgi:hypothetical protein